MDVLHSHLETVKATGLWYLNFSHKSLCKIFKDDAIRGSEESQNHFDEMLFLIIEFGPILQVLGKIDFFSGPETGHLFFVHFPDIVVLDRKDDKPVWVLFEKWLRESLSKALGLILRLLSFGRNLATTMLAIVLLNELGTQLTHYGLLWGLMLALRVLGALESDLLLGHVVGWLRKDLRNFLGVG